MNAQENAEKAEKNRIGVTYSSFGDNIIYRNKELEGAASYDGEKFFTIGVDYLHGLNKWLNIETSLEYTNYHVKVNPAVSPDMDNTSRYATISLVNVPVTLRMDFFNYFFVNGGATLDVDVSTNSPIDDQTGIGTVFGVGAKYDFDIGLSIFVNPYAKTHSILPFSGSVDRHQKIWENGLRIGVTYDL